MIVKIEKSRAQGRILPPASKSMAHRLLIGAALADSYTKIVDITLSEDIKATVDCLCSLGVGSLLYGNIAEISGGIKHEKPKHELNCRESGSTLRFMLPLALLLDEEVIFTGAKRLMERPLGVYENICHDRGFKFERKGGRITVKGRLTSGEYSLPGNISSQFITGLLFALSTLEGDSRINITTEIESRSYIELTRAAMKEFGVEVIWENEHTLFIKGGQKYLSPGDVFVERDFSGAAFPDAFNVLGGDVEVFGLKRDSLQGDRIYREHYKALSKGTPTIDITDCPDLGPILFTLAAALQGAEFTGTARLRIKESDRALAMAEELSKFGADITVMEDSVTVRAAELHSPAEILNGHNDHRIVMSLAVLSSAYGGVIEGAEAVSKSYPDFFKHIEILGIKVQKYEDN